MNTQHKPGFDEGRFDRVDPQEVSGDLELTTKPNHETNLNRSYNGRFDLVTPQELFDSKVDQEVVGNSKKILQISLEEAQTIAAANRKKQIANTDIALNRATAANRTNEVETKRIKELTEREHKFRSKF